MPLKHNMHTFQLISKIATELKINNITSIVSSDEVLNEINNIQILTQNKLNVLFYDVTDQSIKPTK